MAKAVIPNKCFYIVSQQYDKGGLSLALETTLDDAYAPRDTGVHNVELG